MADDRLAALTAAGVSIWLDDLSRGHLVSGGLRRLIDDEHVVGVTTNPTIFAAAIAYRGDHTRQIRELARRGATVGDAARTLMVVDVQEACELFRGVCEASDGMDGRVSLEVNPDLAGNCEATVLEAVSLMRALGCPEPLRAGPCDEGEPAGHQRSPSPRASSSRVSTQVDKRLGEIGSDKAFALRGMAGIANSRLAYQKSSRSWNVTALIGSPAPGRSCTRPSGAPWKRPSKGLTRLGTGGCANRTAKKCQYEQ